MWECVITGVGFTKGVKYHLNLRGNLIDDDRDTRRIPSYYNGNSRGTVYFKKVEKNIIQIGGE